MQGRYGPGGDERIEVTTNTCAPCPKRDSPLALSKSTLLLRLTVGNSLRRLRPCALRWEQHIDHGRDALKGTFSVSLDATKLGRSYETRVLHPVTVVGRMDPQ